MGVIVLFVEQSNLTGFKIVKIGAEYPDAIIEKDGIRYRAEFEFMASNFLHHRHDPRHADVIVCRENDYADSTLTALALSEDGWHTKEIILPTEQEREMGYWKARALSAESKLIAIESRLRTNADGTGEHLGYFCQQCEKEFATVQALNAHKRFCAGKVVVSTNGSAAK